MTDNQQYTTHERDRARQERKYYKVLREAYAKAFEPIERYYELNQVWRAELIDTKPIVEAMNELYLGTSKQSYTRSYKAIKKEGQKAEINIFTTLDEQLADAYAGQMKEWLNTYAAQKIVSVEKTTKAGVRDIIAYALRQGLSVPQVAKLIRQRYALFGRNRSIVISRTETVTASNQGSLGGALSTGLNVRKFWIARRDGRERDSHRDAAEIHYPRDKAIPINDPFIIGEKDDKMSAPGAGHEAEENVNCRCAVGYVVDRR